MAKTQHTPTSIERFLLHLHPKKIDARAIKYSKTYGLGGISALLIILLTITGLLLRFNYVPTPEKAYHSILALQNEVLFGKLLRNIHHLSASLLIITSFLHLIRILYAQALFKERSKNWIYGLFLMTFVLFANFTGYLLPWDQLAYWAVTIITELLEYIPVIGNAMANFVRGGETVNSTTLLNFYNLHTGIIPIVFIFLLSMHFWLIRKAKGILLTQTEEEKPVMVNTYPNLVQKEIITALIVLAVIFLLSIFIDAPLQEKANVLQSPNPTKAPWYFMGVQELLLHIHPTFAVFVIPLAVLFFFFYLPFFKFKNLNQGVWFNSPNGKKIVTLSIFVSSIFTIGLILLTEFGLNFSIILPQLPLFISNGIIPLLLYCLPMGAYLFYAHKKRNLGKEELILALFTLLISSYIIMMVIGIAFRGEGMHLTF